MQLCNLGIQGSGLSLNNMQCIVKAGLRKKITQFGNSVRWDEGLGTN